MLRVWVPDRPGALGAVASRIGAVRGDVVGIEILERGAGRAVDELVVELPDAVPVGLLVHEVSQVDGVDVEEVTALAAEPPDPRLDALGTAARLVAEPTVEKLLAALAARARHDFQADWSAVLAHGVPLPLVTVGAPPSDAWLEAFAAGSRSSLPAATSRWAPDDTAWAELSTAGLDLLLGRKDRPFRNRERQQVAALASVADACWAALVTRTAAPTPLRSAT